MNNPYLRSLHDADRQWSLSAPDLDAFLSFAADDVIWLFCGKPPIRGKGAVREHYEPVFGQPGFCLTWSPDRINVSDDETLGYACGTWTARREDTSGKSVATQGYYATVWRRDASGWRVVLEADY